METNLFEWKWMSNWTNSFHTIDCYINKFESNFFLSIFFLIVKWKRFIFCCFVRMENKVSRDAPFFYVLLAVGKQRAKNWRLNDFFWEIQHIVIDLLFISIVIELFNDINTNSWMNLNHFFCQNKRKFKTKERKTNQ